MSAHRHTLTLLPSHDDSDIFKQAPYLVTSDGVEVSSETASRCTSTAGRSIGPPALSEIGCWLQ